MRLESASLRRRMLAGVIDGIVIVAGFGGAVAALVRWRSSDEHDWVGRLTRGAAWVDSPWGTRAAAVATPVESVLLRHARGPGRRAVGIRRVDARTGAPESLRSAIVRALLDAAVGQAIRRLNAPHREREQTRQAELERRRAELAERFAEDPAALERATAELRREFGRGCVRETGRLIALPLLHPLTALLSPRRQTVIERLAGVAVVRDRG